MKENSVENGRIGFRISGMFPDIDLLNRAGQRQAARAEKLRRDRMLWELHRKAGERLADSRAGEQARLRAMRKVDLWESKRLCSKQYIVGWRRLLSLDAVAFRDAILSDRPEMIAMRQNTPFGFLLQE
jgi:hypothetical protein